MHSLEASPTKHRSGWVSLRRSLSVRLPGLKLARAAAGLAATAVIAALVLTAVLASHSSRQPRHGRRRRDHESLRSGRGLLRLAPHRSAAADPALARSGARGDDRAGYALDWAAWLATRSPNSPSHRGRGAPARP